MKITTEMLDKLEAHWKETQLKHYSNKKCHDCLLDYQGISTHKNIKIYLFGYYIFCICKEHLEKHGDKGKEYPILSEQDIFYLQCKN